jgi:hypothetical protein
MADDLRCYTHENILRQLESSEFELGYFCLQFYTEGGKPVNRKTDTIEPFYLYPSGGTLRDRSFNIVFYDSRFDTNRGFKPPHARVDRRKGSAP